MICTWCSRFGCIALALYLAVVLSACSATPRDTVVPERIVTFAPNLTEIVFALGEADRVVGVSSFCTYPPEVLSDKYVKVGGHFNPNLEKIAALSPSLVLLEGEHAQVAEFCRMNGIQYTNMPIDSLETLDQSIQRIGEILECPERARKLRSEIAAGLDAVRAEAEKATRMRVLIISARAEHDLNSLFTVGGPSFLSEIVELAGGDNIFRDAPQPYFEASKETVVMRAPDVILEFHAGEQLDDAQRAAFVNDWNQLPSLPAVQNKRIHLITDDFILIPGPRVVLTARRIASALHGGAEAGAP